MSPSSQTNSNFAGLDAEIRQAIDGMRRGDRNVLDRMDGLMAEIRMVLEGISKGQTMSGSCEKMQSTLEEVRKELGRHEAMIAQQSADATRHSSEERRSWAASTEALTNVAEALSLLDRSVSDQLGRIPGLEQAMAAASQKMALLLDQSKADSTRESADAVVAAVETRFVKIAAGLEAALRGLFHRVDDVGSRSSGLEARLADRIERVAATVRSMSASREEAESRTKLGDEIALMGKHVAAMTEQLSATRHDTILQSEARQHLLSEKLNRIFKAIQDQRPAPPQDLSPVTDAVGSLDRRFDTVIQKIEGLSLKTTRLEFLAGEQSRNDAVEGKFAALETSVSDVDAKLKEISHKISAMHEDAALRSEARQTLVTDKLNRVLRAIQDQTQPTPEFPPVDLSPVRDAVGVLDKRIDTVLQKIEGLSLKTTRIEFLAGEHANRGDAPRLASIEAPHADIDKGFSRLTSEIERLSSEVSEVRGALAAPWPEAYRSTPASDDQLGELARMVSAGNVVLAELHAMAAREPQALGAAHLPSWTEAWQIINLITGAFDRRFSDLSDRLDRFATGAGTGQATTEASEVRSALTKVRDDLRGDVERFLSIAACLASEMEDLAPKVLMSRTAA